uniref:Uncharacterized protein n=1 Tax=Geoglobus ahangari TaxID=113653 RepID=A0A7C3YCI3_9EURY
MIFTKEFLEEILKRVDALVLMCGYRRHSKEIRGKKTVFIFETRILQRDKRRCFLRPILPTISLKDYYKSIEIIADFTDRIILGNLRLTKKAENILKELADLSDKSVAGYLIIAELRIGFNHHPLKS